MMKNQISSPVGAIATSSVASASAYQAPAIESIVTFENLQREVFYAGGGGGGGSVLPVP